MVQRYNFFGRHTNQHPCLRSHAWSVEVSHGKIRVRRLGNYTFCGCSGLTSVTIPSSVTSIGGSAFKNCSGLTNVYCVATTPPTAKSYSFDDDLSNATLHVYASSVDDYKTTEPWSRFGKIVALTDEEIVTDILEVKEKREEEKRGAGAVYDLNGLQHSSLQRGVHIVRSLDGRTKKVVGK